MDNTNTEELLRQALEALQALRQTLAPLAMQIIYYELGNGPLADGDVVSDFMGGGGSAYTTAKDFRDSDAKSTAVIAHIQKLLGT